MRPHADVLLPVFALLLITAACNGGGQPEATASPAGTGTPQATATETAQVAGTETPQPASTETAVGDASPSPSDGQARLAVVAENQGEFLAQEGVVLKICAYEEENSLVDCAANGLYELQDGIEGTDALCRVMLVDDKPAGLNCQTSDPLQVIGYEIKPSANPTPAP